MMKLMTPGFSMFNKKGNENPNFKHGLSKHPLHKIWSGIKSRCYCESSSHYKDYGNRGIKVCDEWKNNFKTFYDWAINNGWQSSLEINRINNNKNYESNNCNFVTSKINCNNKRNNKIVSYKDKQYTVAQLAEKYNLSWVLTNYRLNNNIPLDKTIR
jgi:hypothetical protein